ncbi:unnamed protein product [Cyprideis torosa]|uniref:Uncharacterized protein n=1 Tax=Cyprideis torosa TaxID=163714 RepID=A0A7R8WS64_9CRUS|nr:unnamed protein product [Cyprideis torosa]CAG0904499.1 unnamed protein product [Cyprideis torosa]
MTDDRRTAFGPPTAITSLALICVSAVANDGVGVWESRRGASQTVSPQVFPPGDDPVISDGLFSRLMERRNPYLLTANSSKPMLANGSTKQTNLDCKATTAGGEMGSLNPRTPKDRPMTPTDPNVYNFWICSWNNGNLRDTQQHEEPFEDLCPTHHIHLSPLLGYDRRVPVRVVELEGVIANGPVGRMQVAHVAAGGGCRSAPALAAATLLELVRLRIHEEVQLRHIGHSVGQALEHTAQHTPGHTVLT